MLLHLPSRRRVCTQSRVSAGMDFNTLQLQRYGLCSTKTPEQQAKSRESLSNNNQQRRSWGEEEEEEQEEQEEMKVKPLADREEEK